MLDLRVLLLCSVLRFFCASFSELLGRDCRALGTRFRTCFIACRSRTLRSSLSAPIAFHVFLISLLVRVLLSLKLSFVLLLRCPSLEAHTQADGGANKENSRMETVVTRRKLVDLVKAQGDEIDFLRKELDRHRKATFPSFA